MELEQLFNSNYSLYIFFYLFGFISIYLIDKYIFPQENSTEKIYIIQESIEDKKNLNKKKFSKYINHLSKIDKYYIVIGLGGVGSKVVMDLIRAGVQRLKVIDYDLVTLSSLNRHAFAKRSDVGKFKSDLIKEYCTKTRPDIIIESIEKPLLKENLEKFLLIPETPDVIIDCIDDLNTKADLYKFCFLRKLKLFSSMGAGGKCDPTSIRFAKFNEIKGEILSKRLKYQVRKKMKEEIDILSDKNNLVPDFECVYSVEKNKRDLAELDEDKRENVDQFRTNFNERVRSLPVFACMPSSFGHCLSSLSI
jgi:tRNA A37 threonylcarbamoyladenosine dehydratase